VCIIAGVSMAKRCVLALVVALAGCGRACGASSTASATSTDARAPEDAAASVLVPPEGRVFFADWVGQHTKELAATELFVRRDGAGAVAIFHDEELSGALDDAGHFKIPAKGERGPIDFTLYDDGTYDGSETYSDGSKSTYVRTPYRPLAPEQLATATGFKGFLSGGVRYRMKLAFRGDDVEGVARYPITREDLKIRGKIQRAARRLEADELGPDGKVTGHVEAIVIGHVVGKPYSASHALVGTWSSPDGKRHMPLRLDEGPYPDRVVVAGGASVSAQERYADDCGTIEEDVFPVIDGAPPGVAKKIELALRTLTLEGPSPDPVDPAQVAALAAGAKVKRQGCENKEPELRGLQQAVYEATPLHATWVAIEVGHVVQQGSSPSMSWLNCVAVDLATGDIVEPAKLLDAKTRDALTTRARKEALAALGDAGRDPLEDGMREAAETLALDDVPICIGATSVKFGIVPHRVFGPAQPVFDRAEVARMLPAGKLHDLVAK
jgi:hypothetical protein